MSKVHPWLPTNRFTEPTVLRKLDILTTLATIDRDELARQRVLDLENVFRQRIDMHVVSLPAAEAKFDAFNTNPFVLLIYASRGRFTKVSQMEAEILPAKIFSSMETSAGKTLESVSLPIYGWESVPSSMHTQYSILDGRKKSEGILTVATLKSGPSTLNDGLTQSLADSIRDYAQAWAGDAGVDEVEFTYGTLYGTRRRSKKKDWQILRYLYDKIGADAFLLTPERRWETKFRLGDVTITATVRIGLDWWDYLGGGRHCPIEVWTALIRACVAAGEPDPPHHPYVVADLADIVSTASVTEDYNVSLLQRSQLPWLFFVAWHFADLLIT